MSTFRIEIPTFTVPPIPKDQEAQAATGTDMERKTPDGSLQADSLAAEGNLTPTEAVHRLAQGTITNRPPLSLEGMSVGVTRLAATAFAATVTKRQKRVLDERVAVIAEGIRTGRNPVRKLRNHRSLVAAIEDARKRGTTYEEWLALAGYQPGDIDTPGLAKNAFSPRRISWKTAALCGLASLLAYKAGQGSVSPNGNPDVAAIAAPGNAAEDDPTDTPTTITEQTSTTTVPVTTTTTTRPKLVVSEYQKGLSVVVKVPVSAGMPISEAVAKVKEATGEQWDEETLTSWTGFKGVIPADTPQNYGLRIHNCEGEGVVLIRKGDKNLGAIASNHKISLQGLKELNGNQEVLAMAGLCIKVPVTASNAEYKEGAGNAVAVRNAI